MFFGSVQILRNHQSDVVEVSRAAFDFACKSLIFGPIRSDPTICDTNDAPKSP